MRRWRWLVVTGGVGLLACVPALVAALPVDEPDVAIDALVARIQASDSTSYEGLYESRGGLGLPDLGRYEDLVAPFAETTRVRVWYADREHWRADTQTIGGETDWYREPDALWRWTSGSRNVVYSPRSEDEPLRFPRAMDLSPAELGRRAIAEADVAEITRLDARRIAGTNAAGLRITPKSTTTTIESIDLWADPDTGVVLRVEVETGGVNPILETQFLDFDDTTPDPDVITFDSDEAGEPVRNTTTMDVVETISQAAALITPATAGIDLPRRGDPALSFGSDFGIVIVGVTPQRGLGRSISALPPSARPWGGDATVVETPLVNVEIATINGLSYVIAGTVTVTELDRIAGLLTSGAS